MKRTLVATATFGLEAVVKREIEKLGYEILSVTDGKITYSGDERAIVSSNLHLRCADRVLLKVADEFTAVTFEDLYQQTRGIEWESLIPVDGKFTVKGSSVKSTLHSVPSCQKIVEKALADRLCDFYGVKHLSEDGAVYGIKVSILKDVVTLTVDTSGEGLHKRGYRRQSVAAPIKETLAAAMVELSFWKKDRLLVDPCCGSGTIAIEAAMIGMNIAPGLNRNFVSEGWDIIDKELWREERAKAREAVDKDVRLKIVAVDISRRSVESARANAEAAGVAGSIEFRCADLNRHMLSGNPPFNEARGVIITNPPYGVRIGEEEEVQAIYETLHHFLETHKDWSLFAVTSDKDFEKKCLQRRADRRRKLYNGRMEVCYYQCHGEK